MAASSIRILCGVDPTQFGNRWLRGVQVIERDREPDTQAGLVRTCGRHEFSLVADRVGVACLWRRGAGQTAVPGEGITLTAVGGDVATFAHLAPREALMLGERLIAAALAVDPDILGDTKTEHTKHQLVEMSGGA